MENRRNSWRGRGNDRGDDRGVSSYASLATGPPPSYVERGEDDYRGGGRGGRSRGRGRGRGRGGRGRGRGRGGRGFRGGRDVGSDRDRYGDRGPDRSSPSRNSSIATRGSSAVASSETKSGDDSGYESGELSPSPPKPVMDPPRRMLPNPNDNFNLERRPMNDDFDHRGRFDDRGDPGNPYRDGPPPRFMEDRNRDRPPFESRGSFTGGRGDDGGRGRGRGDFDGRGRGGRGRGRGRMGGGRFESGGGRGRGRGGRGGRFFDDRGGGRDGGRGDFGGRGRGGDRRDSFRGMDDMPMRDPERDRPRDMVPRRDGPRDMPRDGPIRDGPRDLPRRDEMFRDGPREPPRRDEPFRDGPREMPRRDEPFRDGPREPPRRDEPFRDGPRDPPRRDEPFRDGPREPPRRDEPFRDGPREMLRRDEPFRDGPREPPRTGEPFRDGPRELSRRDEPFRDGPREFPHRDGPQELQRHGSRDFPRDAPRDFPRRDEPMRDGPRDFPRRDEPMRDGPRDFPRRDEPMRDGPRDPVRRDGPRDFPPRRDEMMRDGPREPPRDGHGDGPRDLRLDDKRYPIHLRLAAMSGSYRNILNETGQRNEQEPGHDQVHDRFPKRGRDDRDFHPSDRDEKRPRPEDHGPRDMNRQMSDPYTNNGKPYYNDRAPGPVQGMNAVRDGPIGRNGGPPPRENIGGHDFHQHRPDLPDDQRRDYYGRESRPLDIAIDRGEAGPARFGGREVENPNRSPGHYSVQNRPPFPERNPPMDRGGRGRGRGGRGPFRGRGPGRSDFGRGDGGRNLPPRDRDGREMNAIPPYHRNESQGKHPNSGPMPKRDQRERESLPSFSSYGQLASNETKPAKARTPAVATTTPGKPEQPKPREGKPTPTNSEAKIVKKQEVEAPKPPPGPKVPSPPPKGKPTGAMLALARLVELEASMEYAYTKHMLLIQRQEELAAQYKVLETLPVGIDAIKDELEAARLQTTPQDAN